MRHWHLREIDDAARCASPSSCTRGTGPSAPSSSSCRPAQALGEHQVKEAALLLVLDGAVLVAAGDESVDGGAGSLFHFDPDERHSVTSAAGARLLLLLAPWPGEGHYRGDRPAASGVSAS